MTILWVALLVPLLRTKVHQNRSAFLFPSLKFRYGHYIRHPLDRQYHQLTDISRQLKHYIKELDATRDKSNDEFIEELIDECLEETEQVSENITLDEIIKNFDKTYEEFKFKYFLKKVLQNDKALT